MNCVFVHASSTHEFGSMHSDCLVQFSILYPFLEPHDLRFRSCILHPRVWRHSSWLRMVDPLVQSSILQCVLHRQVRTLLTRKCDICYFPDWFLCQTCILYYCCFCCCLYFVLRCAEKKGSRDESHHGLITEGVRRTKSVSYLCFPLISDKR